MITLVVVTDGRDCITETIAAAREHLHGPITRKIVYDDTGDIRHRGWLGDNFPDFVVTHHEDGRQGFGGAIRHLWRWLAANDPNRFLLHLEDDFVVNRDVDLLAMAAVLERNPFLLQMVLRRQAWNDEERAAGGLVERNPESFTDCHDGTNDWLEHRNWWSTNPHLCRMAITHAGWPEDPHSEGKFTQRMIADPDVRFGIWGARESGAWVEHVGRERVGHGY